MQSQLFKITEQHLQLLKRLNVTWDNSEEGAPAIDPKRPYGNSSIFCDINDILNLNLGTMVEYGDDGEYFDIEYTDEDYELVERLHREMETVLEIVLSTLSFRKGYYVKESKYDSYWAYRGL